MHMYIIMPSFEMQARYWMYTSQTLRERTELEVDLHKYRWIQYKCSAFLMTLSKCISFCTEVFVQQMYILILNFISIICLCSTRRVLYICIYIVRTLLYMQLYLVNLLMEEIKIKTYLYWTLNCPSFIIFLWDPRCGVEHFKSTQFNTKV